MNLIKRGILADSQPVAVNVGGNIAPMTVTLVSSDLTRNIELSSDGGINFYTPPRDVDVATMINVVLMAPVSHVRFTGVAGNVWSVR